MSWADGHKKSVPHFGIGRSPFAPKKLQAKYLNLSSVIFFDIIYGWGNLCTLLLLLLISPIIILADRIDVRIGNCHDTVVCLSVCHLSFCVGG